MADREVITLSVENFPAPLRQAVRVLAARNGTTAREQYIRAVLHWLSDSQAGCQVDSQPYTGVRSAVDGETP